MWQLMIEAYSKEGDWILDPLAGIGTSLVAALMGRNVICVELEAHFVAPMRASWEKMRTMPMLGFEMGSVVILRGDARRLPLLSADVALMSPPFEGITAMQDRTWIDSHDAELPKHTGTQERQKTHNRKTMEGYTYAKRLHVPLHPLSVERGTVQEPQSVPQMQGPSEAIPASVNSIITSPPYQDERQGGGLATRQYQERSLVDGTASGIPGRKNTRIDQWAYTRPQVDAVLTSPSYGDTTIGGTESLGQSPFGGPTSQARGLAYAPANAENIGNQRGAAYWSAMKQVYAECYRVLPPGGIMALVLKGFTRDGAYVDLPGQTEALLLGMGWEKQDEWRRELWSLSFWRILQQRRDPAAFDERLKYETVLAFRKPASASGNTGVDVGLTSPPYEGSVSDNKEGPLQTSVPGGWKADTVNKHGGYTRPEDGGCSPNGIWHVPC